MEKINYFPKNVLKLNEKRKNIGKRERERERECVSKTN
jgi:hypothetical protein